MRSQASKPLPKKGASNKTLLKSSSAAKQSSKKSGSAKKVKNVGKIKSPKKNASKNDSPAAKKDEDSGSGHSSEISSDNVKAGPSKISARSDSPSKKTKKSQELKEKKDAPKNISETPVKKAAGKKLTALDKPAKTLKSAAKNKAKDKNDAKYKINLEAVKKTTAKFSKAKTIIKKSAGNRKKKGTNQGKQSTSETEDKNEQADSNTKEDNKTNESKSENILVKDVTKSEARAEIKSIPENTTNCDLQLKNGPNQSETQKGDHERPPKFFTSIRSPRTVDIDVKCYKTAKGSVSERFLSMKFESKNEELEKDKSASNTLVSQGPEIDVYTFTEKVDSPKSILSDFRNPINKNVGRVRPIARVKGTVIDKKTDSDKKKYSPHRPIEEVVKQLKANKRSEELNTNQVDTTTTASSVDSSRATSTGTNESDDNPKPIVSKSYKMVARKSSITGKPFSPIQFLDQEPAPSSCEKNSKTTPTSSKTGPAKTKKQGKKNKSVDDEMETSKFSANVKSVNYISSDDSVHESNDDNDSKESSESDSPKTKKVKNKKYKRITDTMKKAQSKELKELSKDSLVDLKDESMLLGGEKPSKRRLKLLSMWAGPKRHRMASLNAIAKVHCLYENESRTHMELGLMKTVDRQAMPSTSKAAATKKKDLKFKEIEKQERESTSESEYEGKKDKKEGSSESSDDNPPQRSLRGVPGIRSAGKYWDPKSSTSSSDDSELDTKKKTFATDKKKATPKSYTKNSDSEKPPAKMKKTAGVPVKKKRNRTEVVMDLKDMVVQKRMASLNATAILAASYEKRSPKSSKDETTSDSCSDESFSQKPKNGVSSGVKSELKHEDTKNEIEEGILTDRKQKVEVIVNQDTDVTITGVYSTHHHEGFCSVTGMQYRISSTSHTQTTATANCEKEACSREDGSRYTPLSALSSMQPPAEHTHPHPVAEIGGLSRRPGCSSAFSAPAQAAHHEPGFYQPAGPLIKESGADAERALARYHPPPHYHAPHPPVLQQYGPPYYPDLCYGRYYRPPGPYHMPPPQPDAPLVGVGSEPYPPPYYGTPPCYNHSPPRIPYVEYRGCSCSLNPCPKNVHIGPATGKAPASGGPDVTSALAPPGGAFRPKVRACALDAVADTHGSGKDPPIESEPPAAADAPHQMCPIPEIGGASPKRELFDMRDSHRRGSDLPCPTEPLGPPSPARGSAGVCAPQPPSTAPRRARLGKAMARRSLVGDDTGLLLTVPQPMLAHHSDADDDVMAISPPLSAPIDLSSSDERSTPLVDVKKENEGPTYASSRKPDALALREHNSTTMSETAIVPDTNKTVKRRYSRPKLEIDMNHTQLEDVCKTNGIGEHVKLQKRRKTSSDQTDIPRTETITKESKKKTTQSKRAPKTPSSEKKCTKRKIDSAPNGPRCKKLLLDPTDDEDLRLKNVAAMVDESPAPKPKTKSALLLDNLIRKNSIDRADSKGYTSEKELNPAELFLPPNENIAHNGAKKTLNINNNIVDGCGNTGVRANTIAAVSQLIGKKMAYKNACKVEKVDSKVTNSLKSVLKTGIKEERKTTKCDISNDKSNTNNFSKSLEALDAKCETTVDIDGDMVMEKYGFPNDKRDSSKDKVMDHSKTNEIPTKLKVPKPYKTIAELEPADNEPIKESVKTSETAEIEVINLLRGPEEIENTDKPVKRCKLTNGDMKGKNVEKVVKLLASKRPLLKPLEAESARRRRRRRTPLAAPAPEPRGTPRWSNGWNWDGEHYVSKVYLNNDSRLDRVARCWSRMTHASGDRVARGDCVLLRASQARAQPFVARVASLWENPDDGEMMVSLVWYYRPEHTERGREPADAPDEVFASRHRDANSVACIEDKCYVLTFNEYCRYRKRLKAMEEGITTTPSIVPPIPASEINPTFAPNDSKLPPSVSPELVLFCRKVYDFRSKKIHVPNK